MNYNHILLVLFKIVRHDGIHTIFFIWAIFIVFEAFSFQMVPQVVYLYGLISKDPFSRIHSIYKHHISVGEKFI